MSKSNVVYDSQFCPALHNYLSSTNVPSNTMSLIFAQHPNVWAHNNPILWKWVPQEQKLLKCRKASRITGYGCS